MMTRLYRSLRLASMGMVFWGMLTATAWAVPQDFLPAGGGLAFKFVDFETTCGPASVAACSIQGIFNITSIQDAGQTTTYWTNTSQPGPVGNLTGRFTGLVQTSFTPSGGGFDFTLTSGTLQIYNVPTGSFHPTAPPATDVQICGGPCPSPWLVANFNSGIDPSNPAVFVSGHQSAATVPFTAHSSGYLDVVGGTMFARLNSNIFVTTFGKRDLFFESNFCTKGTGPGCTFGTTNKWPVKSNDPVVGHLVPEPTSVILFGTGLLSVGLWEYRRRQRVVN